MLFALLVIVTACGIIAYQDFKERYIHIAAILLLFTGLFLNRMNELTKLLNYFIINLVFLFILFGMLYLYFRMIRGSKKLIDRHIGLGDVLVFFVFTIAFNTFNYVLFLCTGCIAALMYWTFQTFAIRKVMIRIPLAGIFSIYYITVLLISKITAFDLFTKLV